MELKQAIGLRRSVRYLDPTRPVERAKIQKMLEAARRASHWGNVQTLRAVVVERATAPAEVMDSIDAFIGNFQVKVAPVIIVWFLDAQAVDEQPQRLREIVDARAMGVDYAETKEKLEKTIIPFFENLTAVLKAPGMSEMDCGQGIAQATLIAFEEGLGTCLLGSKLLEKLPKALGLPPQARVLVLQTVGYPAEDVYRSGQRPRLPFERLFHLNHFGSPFPREPAVVKELEEAGLIQFVGPDDRARRDLELAELQSRFDYPPL